jgi:hypothetical protein
MKRVLLIALALVMISGAAMADHIGIYNDQVASGCTLVAPGGFVPYSIFVVHRFTVGATGSQFAVNDVSTQAATGFAALGGFLVIGNLADLSLAYGACLTGPDIPAVQLNYFAVGNPSPCGLVEIIPAPSGGGNIKYTDCNFAEIPATGGQFWFNSGTSCNDCDEPPTVATEESTWGKVKSLYR